MTNFPFSQKAARATDPPISWLMKVALDRGELVSLAAGFTSNEILPVDDLRATIDEILGGDPVEARKVLQYGSTIGREPLRRLLLDRLGEADGIDPARFGLSADDVVLTSGSQQLLYLVADVLLDPGDWVLLEAPTYFVFLGILEGLGARKVGVPIGERGIEPSALETALNAMKRDGRLSRLKLVYLVSYYQNPSGATIPADAKGEILSILEHYRREAPFFVVEDAAYRDLRFEGRDVPSMKSLDARNEFVVYAGTFTKPLSTGMKCGYGILPEALVPHVLRQKGNHDFGSAHFNQAVVERFLESGRYDALLERLREHYRAKMDVMDRAMREFFPPSWTWRRPEGGLYIWAEGPEGLDTGMESGLFRRALEEGVLYVPGAICYGLEPGKSPPINRMRLSYGHPTVADIREGIRRLGAALDGAGKGKPGGTPGRAE